MSTNKSQIISITDSANCENCWVNNFSAFKNCSPEIRQEITNNTKTREYNKGEYMIKTGETERGVFCIQKGLVKVSKKGNRKKEFILWLAEADDLIGLNSFIDDEPFSYSATAISPVTACFILSSDLKKILKKEPIIFVHLIKEFMREVK